MTGAPVKQALKIGCVSYLNAKPLIYGLDEASDLDFQLDVPARLIDGLRDRRFDVALLPVIDYQRLAGLRMLSAGGIGCFGPTLTVRIFSRVPIEKIATLSCDTHSHSSVALQRVILAEAYGIRPEMIDLQHDAPSPSAIAAEARLLIGDKVVCDEPTGFPHQLDLGQAWKKLTGLPFLFAAWFARKNVEVGDLPDRLRRAKFDGLDHVDEIVDRHAVPRGWPGELARQYLTEYLKYDVGPRQIEAVKLFHALAFKNGMIGHPAWELDVD